VQGSGSRVRGFGVRGSGFGVRGSGFGVRGYRPMQAVVELLIRERRVSTAFEEEEHNEDVTVLRRANQWSKVPLV
jgi:hypothetical protein